MTAKAGTGRTSGYHSPLRARQAAETRRLIISAATELFWEHGWAATTLPMIARRAGTALDTVHTAFGSKIGLLMAVVDVAILGDDEDTAMIDRPEFALFGKGTRAERLRTGVRFTLGVYERSVPILRTLQEAAASDETARARLVQYDEDRRNVIVAGLALILGKPAADELVDGIWALASPDVFTLLTDRRGWSLQEVETWLVQMCGAAMRVKRGIGSG